MGKAKKLLGIAKFEAAFGPQEPDDGAHSEFGASASERWLECPGSVVLSRGMPNQESKYAAEGTEAHAVYEFFVLNRHMLPAAKLFARAFCDIEMITHAENATNFIVELASQLPDAEICVEKKVNASRFTCEGQFGTLDTRISSLKKRKLIVLDFKYGAGIPVDADGGDGKGNSQLAYYGLATLLELGVKNFDDVEMWVLQPRADHVSGETERKWSCKTADLLEWGKKFKKGVKVALGPNPPFKFGEKHCRFCPAKLKCEVIKDQAFKQARIDFAPKTDTIGKLPDIKKEKDLGKLLSACEKLEVFIKAVREAAYNQAKRGLPVKGYKLVEKRTTRYWTNEAKAAKQARAVMGEKAFTTPKLLSPAQFEKAFKKSKSAKAWLAKNISTKTGGTTLAPIASKKKAIGAFSEFEAVEGDYERTWGSDD